MCVICKKTLFSTLVLGSLYSDYVVLYGEKPQANNSEISILNEAVPVWLLKTGDVTENICTRTSRCWRESARTNSATAEGPRDALCK